MEGFSHLIKKQAGRGFLRGVAASKDGPKVSHLFFADDSLLFLKANHNECGALKEVLQQYEVASGQSINLDKSSIMFSSNIMEDRRNYLQNILGIQNGLNDELYLGLPLMFGKERKRAFMKIIERVKSRIGGWNAKLLSQAAKGVLIRSVAQSIPTYSMSCFLIPKGVINKINSLLAGFWWGDVGGRRKIHWIAWHKLCKSKLDGGQGFREIEAFNLAMLAKQWWRLLHDPSLLSHRVLQSKYCSTGGLHAAKLGRGKSYLWRSLMRGKEIIDKGGIWRVGDGRRIQVWTDNWIGSLPEAKPIWQSDSAPPRIKVHQLIDDRTKQWKMNLLREQFSEEEAECISKIPLARTEQADKLIWRMTPSGVFTVRSAYYIASKVLGHPVSDVENRDPLWKEIWRTKAAPKVINFIWRLAHGILPTGLALRAKDIPTSTTCPVCCEENESARHACFACVLSLRACKLLSNELGAWIENHLNDEDFMKNWIKKLLQFNLKEQGFILAWLIWKNRNKARYEERCDREGRLVEQVSFMHKDYTAAMQKFGTMVVPSRSQSVNWVKPQDGRIKINVDAGFPSPGIVRLGVVARDSLGAVLFSCVVGVANVTEVLHGELLAIQFGMDLACEQDLRKVEIESDSLTSIKELESHTNSFSPWGVIIHDIMELFFAFEFCSFKHISRKANRIAHELTKIDVMAGNQQFWWRALPNTISDVEAIQNE